MRVADTVEQETGYLIYHTHPLYCYTDNFLAVVKEEYYAKKYCDNHVGWSYMEIPILHKVEKNT